jgi:ribonuclease D
MITENIPQTIGPQCDHSTVTFEQAVRALSDGPIALDLETFATDERSGDDALDPGRGEIRLVSLCSERGEPQLIDHLVTPIPAAGLAELLKSRLVIMHHAAFDCAWLKAKLGFWPARIFDTLTAERVLTNGLGVRCRLEDTVMRNLGVTLNKGFGGSDWGTLFLSDEQLCYAGDDVQHLHALMTKQEGLLQAAGLYSVFECETALLRIVQHMQENGIMVDAALLESLRDELALEASSRAARLREGLGVLNANSPAQLKVALNAAGVQVGNTAEKRLPRMRTHFVGWCWITGILRCNDGRR